MKPLERIVIVALGMLCLTITSCNKEPKDSYLDYVWIGEYPVQTVNGSTGETEEQTGVIQLYFQAGSTQCTLAFGIAGMYGMSLNRYDVRWTDNERFALYGICGVQTLLCYSGTLSGEKMVLQAFNCDSVAASYDLTRKRIYD